jgi:CheY-like chemotaxis protein
MKEGGGLLTVALDDEVLEAGIPESPLALPAGRYARVVVSDTGTGMTPETMERVFEPFFTTKPPGEGTGLGMAVTHGIILSHRGHIGIDSEIGGGTRISVLLPLSGSHGQEADVGEERGRATGARHRQVMVVDDEAAVGRLVSRILERSGCTVHPFESPVEAARAVVEKEISPDLIISDQTMPGLTGLELVSKLRETRPGLPAVIMSGYDAALEGHALDVAGVQAFLRKPFIAAEMMRVIEALCGAPEAEQD